MRIILKTQPLEAWRYGYGLTPNWLEQYLEINEAGDLLLVRHSGKQVVNLGEWIVIDEDSELAHMTDAYVKRFYEVVE